ncbi:MAG: hypothetical protein M3680_23010 [Myxococcota bacterium]|nr:hypothetical protein [Myxococcota bacterium]
MEARVFKWSGLALAVIAVAMLGYLLNDVRRELARTSATLHAGLPQIVENVRVGTVTLANVSRDIEALRDLLGVSATSGDRSLVQYADSVLDFLDAQTTGQVGLTKVVGTGLKDVVAIQDWVRDARKEALWLTFRASSKAELLDRLAHTKFGSAWHYTAPGIPATPLAQFVKLNHAASKGL